MVCAVQPESGTYAAPEDVEAAVVAGLDRVLADSRTQVVQLEPLLQIEDNC
jgi:hypothetical protein